MPFQFTKYIIGIKIQIILFEKNISVIFPIIEPLIENHLHVVLAIIICSYQKFSTRFQVCIK